MDIDDASGGEKSPPAPATAMPANPRREALAPWFVALVLSGVLVLLLELNRRKPDHHAIGIQIGAGVLIWIALATIIRFIVFVVDEVRWR
jgi:hypothetical protein